jgi:hypothetical protein
MSSERCLHGLLLPNRTTAFLLSFLAGWTMSRLMSTFSQRAEAGLTMSH